MEDEISNHVFGMIGASVWRVKLGAPGKFCVTILSPLPRVLKEALTGVKGSRGFCDLVDISCARRIYQPCNGSYGSHWLMCTRKFLWTRIAEIACGFMLWIRIPKQRVFQCTVMDFQPQNPEDPLVAVAALLGHGIPGVFVLSGSCFFCLNLMVQGFAMTLKSGTWPS
jgi:hypothetical protein